MPFRQLITIPMATGVTGNTLHLSLALVPRLHQDGVLSDYTDDWAQWPNIAGALQYRVFFNNNPNPINPTRVSVVSQPPDIDVWEAMFFDQKAKVAQPVAQYRFVDRRDTSFLTFPGAAVADGLRDLIAEVSDRFPEHPPTSSEALSLASTAVLKGSTLPDADDYLEPTEDPPVTPTDGPGLEFHQLLTVLRAHPHLLRLLGLVVDLDIQLIPVAPRPALVRVRTDWAPQTGAAPQDECPLAMMLDGDQWPLAIFTDEHTGPYLKLSDASRYAMTTSDLASASQRLLDYQQTVLDRPDEPAPLPVPREAGVAVVHARAAESMRRRTNRQRQLENQIDRWFTGLSNQPPVIGLEDVTAGYRYDVYDRDAPEWRSVFARRARDGYQFPRDSSLDTEVPDDEGRWVLAVSTEGNEIVAPRSTSVQYAQEGKPNVEKREGDDKTTWRLPIDAFRWNGWSAATPNPGASLNGSGDAQDPADNVVADDQEAQLEVSYAPVPRTLPLLRYGRTYRMRARATDLAGNSRAITDLAPSDAPSASITFGRTQPVEPPLPIRTVPKPVPGIGDTSSTLVIKSELDQPLGEIAPTSRHLYPPRLSQARLELHGLPEGGVDADSYEFLATRDALRLDDQAGVDPVSGDLVSGSFDAGGGHVRADEQPVAEYLVDPAARAITFAGAPGREEPIVVDLRDAWPDPRALEIELAAGDDETATPADGVVAPVRFLVPPGRVRNVELSHGLDPDLVDHFDAFRALPQSRQIELRELVERGRHHVISARAPLTLVHAVRLPIEPAAFSGAEPAVEVERSKGSRHAAFSGGITLDRPSTRQIVVVGTWTDPVDDLDLDGPVDRTFRADQAVLVDLDPVSDDAVDWERVGLLERTRLDLVDPRRHTVTLEMDAFSRFSRYFTEQVDGFSIPAAAAEAALPVKEGVVAKSVAIETDRGDSLVNGVDFAVDRATGTITATKDGQLPLDSPLTVRYVPLPISRSSTEAPWGTTTVVVPSALRPSPPVVADMVPAARREITESSDEIVVDHDGRVARVMLKRPWWSSGEEERLAVLLDPSPSDVPDRTRWGRDPLLDSTGSLPTPSVDHFPAATEAVTDRGDVDIAAHAVRFDEGRGVWLADVELDADVGERPFVQFTLGRYQPVALAGLELSDEIQTEPMRLGPYRRVVVRTTGTSGTLRCAVERAPTDHLVRVRVQRADPSIADADLRWSDVLDGVDPMVVDLAWTPGADPSEHAGDVALPATGDELRLVVEDLEPVERTDATTGEAVPGHEIVYRETIDVPADWRV